jgi:hypothetical protein
MCRELQQFLFGHFYIFRSCRAKRQHIKSYNSLDKQILCEQKVYSSSSLSADCPSVGVYSTFAHAIKYADNCVFFAIMRAFIHP